MKTSAHKSKSGKFLFVVLTAIVVSLGAAFASQQEDQIAIQLGGLKLKVDVNSAKASDADIARALVQGRAMMESTASKAQTSVANQSFAANQVQTEETRALVLEATKKALSTPVTRTISRQEVALANGKNVSVAAILDPQKTSASAIAALALRRIPNASPEITKSAVAAALKLVNGAPQFRAGGNTPEKTHEAQLQDASKAAGFALDSLQRSNPPDLSQATAAIAKGALNGIGSGDQREADAMVLVQSMVENVLYNFQYAPAQQLLGLSNFAQNSAPGKTGFVDPNLNEAARSAFDGIVKGAIDFANSVQKSNSQALSQNTGDANVAVEKSETADSGPVATIVLRANAGGGLGSMSLVQMVARAVSQGVVASYLSACRAAGTPPMTYAQVMQACRESIIAAYTALGVTVPVETFVSQVIQQMMLQSAPFRQLVQQNTAANEGALNGAGNPNLSGVGQNVGIASPVTNTTGK